MQPKRKKSFPFSPRRLPQPHEHGLSQQPDGLVGQETNLSLGILLYRDLSRVLHPSFYLLITGSAGKVFFITKINEIISMMFKIIQNVFTMLKTSIFWTCLNKGSF
uniref:Uncharacterized protein n=1 Tax=Lepeophtheirus salmonis TaxID=72036 RepID=A0A0K2UCZ8_LEPSM